MSWFQEDEKLARRISPLWSTMRFCEPGCACREDARFVESIEIRARFGKPGPINPMASNVRHPYEGIHWETVDQYVANLHCHTMMSDGRAMPDEMIECYVDAGYDVLALTDHDSYHKTREGEPEIEPTSEPTWPWSDWLDTTPSRTWSQEGMETAARYDDLGNGVLAIRGNEIKPSPELVSLFNDCGYLNAERAREERLEFIAARDGLSFWAHPMDYLPGGRWDDHFDDSFERGVEVYAEHLASFQHNCGVEMQAKDPAMALKLYEELLEKLGPAEDVVLFANDDAHRAGLDDDVMFNLIFAPELTAPAIYEALQAGRMLVGERSDPLPRIHEISVDESREVIRVDAEGYDSISWVCDGETVMTGPRYEYGSVEGATIRFELRTAGSTLYSQAFRAQ